MTPGSRRAFLTRAGIMAAGATLAAPAVADYSPKINWTMTSAFPPSLDLIHSGVKTFVAALSDATDGGLTIAVQPPDANASAVDAMDAVAGGKADCAHTSLCYASTKNPAYLFGSGAPFGMNARQHGAWLKVGGGNELIDNLLAERGLMAMPMGSTGGQMAGWFRKELHSARTSPA